jgi:hypothetical protein
MAGLPLRNTETGHAVASPSIVGGNLGLRSLFEIHDYFRLLRDFVHQHPWLFALTEAGCSTNSGIPDYRESGTVGSPMRP